MKEAVPYLKVLPQHLLGGKLQIILVRNAIGAHAPSYHEE
jgi:hypothetical protein